MFILTNGLFTLELRFKRLYIQLSSLRTLVLLPPGLFYVLFTWGSRSPFGKCEDNVLLGCDTYYFSIETLKIEAVGFYTTLVSVWQSTVRQIPEEFIFNTHAYVLPKLACKSSKKGWRNCVNVWECGGDLFRFLTKSFVKGTTTWELKLGTAGFEMTATRIMN